ncbi:MAG: radical SAM protein [Planctomycetes bacterium]|jgi:putative pyruvate formate lyase activating enzyme|nr:radical SAM protein [Planctomycetota bacterium]
MAGPNYLRLERGEVRRRADRAFALRSADGCALCPGACRARRDEGEQGRCLIGDKVVVSSVSPHFGEEPCLVGTGGSGTIFFSGCNLHCVFCQNHDVSSRPDIWREVTAQELASFMLSLEARGVENLNLVTPTHIVPEVLDALDIAIEGGLTLPIVFNTSGYDAVVTLELLEGIVDIYMPDFKWSDPAAAKLCANAPDYPVVAQTALREMHRQVGDLVLDERGVAIRGLLVRHLVLPNGLAGTAEVIRFLREEISPRTCVNIMDQYQPAHLARAMPELNRRVTEEEYDSARRLAVDAGLRLADEI